MIKMRQEFEAWVLYAVEDPDISKGGDGEYLSRATHWMYCAWVGSREALEVELPTGGYFAGYDNEHMMESRDVREALEEVGIKVKI